jgi:hypothetical protein
MPRELAIERRDGSDATHGERDERRDQQPAHEQRDDLARMPGGKAAQHRDRRPEHQPGADYGRGEGQSAQPRIQEELTKPLKMEDGGASPVAPMPRP